MFLKKSLTILAVTLLFLSIVAPQNAMACQKKNNQCPTKQAVTKSMERTAGSTPVYNAGKKCCKKEKAQSKACCKKTGRCPMDHKATKTETKTSDPHAGHTMHNKTSSNRPEAKALDAAMASMHKNMNVPYTGDADADFIRGMIPHHQGALEMARIVLKHGDDEAAKKLARNIIKAQKSEIAWMQRWLKNRQIPETGEFTIRK
jgi:Domain of unknown function (DUF305)